MTVTLLGPAETLDRQSGRRGDTGYVAELLAHSGARMLLIENLDPLIGSNRPDAEASVWHPVAGCLPHLEGSSLLLLGVGKTDGVPCFAARTTAEQRDTFSPALTFEPLIDFRTLASSGTLPAGDIAWAGLARSVFAWHDSARHCGWCGGATRSIDAGWKRRCVRCERDAFPRLDPVVIMLVTDGDRCALAHEPRYPPGMFSALAGYLEPGEDIAHAVMRETLEEIGVTVTRVTYFHSQPWPFPHSLMIGCIAHCAPSALTIDRTELVEARWFTRAEAASLLARTHPDELWVPGPQAIAHSLIQAFVQGF